MVLQTTLVIVSLLGLFLSGCGPAVTNETVREKVITKDDMERYREEQEKLAKMGVKGVKPLEQEQKAPSKTGR